MGIRTGQQYRASLRDERKLYIDGQLVQDVTAYGPLQGVIDTIASLHDDDHGATALIAAKIAKDASRDAIRQHKEMHLGTGLPYRCAYAS